MSTWAFLLLALVCPISMGTMMFFMMRGSKEKNGADINKPDSDK
jgi:hypothetical protein